MCDQIIFVWRQHRMGRLTPAQQAEFEVLSLARLNHSMEDFAGAIKAVAETIRREKLDAILQNRPQGR